MPASSANVVHHSAIPLDDILSLPSRSNLRSHLYNLTRRSHVAGTPGDYHDAHYVLDALSALPGFEARIENVDVMLTYPSGRPHLVAPDIKYVASLSEDVLAKDSTSDTMWRNHTFNAYSPSGNVTAPLVYANYGRPSDFDALEQLGISVQNKLVLMRYGKCFRGLKAMNAESRGAIGSIIYSDPKEDGYAPGRDTYPKGPWRPESGVQRGSVQFNSRCAGDPWRLYATKTTKKEDDATTATTTTMTVEDICGYPTEELIPRHPVLPISYGDAEPLLRALGGPIPPAEAGFQGGLDELVYRVGPSAFGVTLVTQNSFNPGKIPNVIATMEGTDHNEAGPVILGNHRDAWVFGAVDPNSGTTALLEVGRCLSALYRNGWRPKRTIILASWSGEEYGLLGSTAFAEMHENDYVVKDAIAYLNVDIAVGGNKRLEASATHSLDKMFLDAASKIPSPDNDPANPHKKLIDSVSGEMGTLGSGSDYTAFLDRYGIASLDMSYRDYQSDYGVYHSVYDSFDWMVNECDKDFFYHEAMTRLWLLMAYDLASSTVLNFAIMDQAEALVGQIGTLSKPAMALGVDLDPLELATKRYMDAAEHITDEAKKVSDDDLDHIQSVNNRLATCERKFLGPGLPHRPWFKHVLQAPGQYLGYGSRTFPGIADSLDAHDRKAAEEQAKIASNALHKAAECLFDGFDAEENASDTHEMDLV